MGKHAGQSSPPPTWHIFAALAATVLGFAGSILFSHRIEDDAVSIATDASPAIQHLTMARTEILRIQLGVRVSTTISPAVCSPTAAMTREEHR
jgi:hypothetical protein